MSKKLFALVGGYVYSENDKQQQYIGPYILARLYGLTDRAHECIFASGDDELQRLLLGRSRDLIYLHPRADGNYSLPPSTPSPGEVS